MGRKTPSAIASASPVEERKARRIAPNLTLERHQRYPGDNVHFALWHLCCARCEVNAPVRRLARRLSIACFRPGEYVRRTLEMRNHRVGTAYA
jgi:hypothetical protein